jgi:hypothetical protein
LQVPEAAHVVVRTGHVGRAAVIRVEDIVSITLADLDLGRRQVPTSLAAK